MSPRVQGYVLLFLASVCFSLMSMLVRVVGKGHAAEAMWLRFGVGILVVGVLWRWGRAEIRPARWGLLAVRGAMGAGAVLVLFISINRVGLAQGSVLSFAYPIFTALFATLIFRERPRRGVWVAMLVAFAGVYLIIWPRDWSGEIAYKLLAVGGSVMAGLAVSTIPTLRQRESSYTIFLSMCLFGFLIASVLSLGKPFRFSSAGWAALMGVAAFATIGQLMMTFAYKAVPATQGSIFSYVTPVMNVVLGWGVFHEPMPARAWLGAVMVIGPCVYVSLAGRRPAPDEVR